MEARSMNHKNTGWRNEWRNLIEQRFVQPSSKPESGQNGNGVFTAPYELTETGEEKAGSPEQKEMKRLMEATVSTTQEEHARIRKLCLNNRAVQIFDLLLKHGSLTRKELAATIGISDRGAPFSYGLRHLKRLGYIVVDVNHAVRGRKLLKLSDKAFLDPKDRPEPIQIDPEKMSAKIDKVYGKEMRKASAKKLPSKKETIVTVEVDNDASDSAVHMDSRDDE